MFLADTHTHSSYSFDSSSSVEQMIQGARQRQVDVLCLTEHCDFGPMAGASTTKKGSRPAKNRCWPCGALGKSPKCSMAWSWASPR